ncbi:MAG: N-acetylglutaminylglutamine amidotransferase [Acidimicrobiales bacterium]
MCGISGEIRFDGRATDLEAVERMTRALAPRGPDGHGTWAHGPVALGHRRLAIIDVSPRGAQPMADEELGCTIAFNGCIYNHRELRRELEGVGYRFRSTSDTEVILKAHHRWGDDAPEHLSGMFAYALHWTASGRTLLVRDRQGIKPLYLTDDGDRLRFASTLPALLAGGGVRTEVDPVGLHHYLTFHSIVPAPHTVLADVRKLPPATMLSIEPDGRQEERTWWRATYGPDPDRADWTEREWQDAIADALRTAVRRRLVADVPVGVLLSGGLDASLLVALLAEEAAAPPSTFSIGFDPVGGRAGDEYRWSDRVAQECGTDHHRLHVPSADVAPALPGAVAAMSEPMASHDVVAFGLLSQVVADHVKVVQSGQGADEVFAGYHWFSELATCAPEATADAYLDAFRDRPHDELAALVPAELLPTRDVSAELVRRHADDPEGLAPGAGALDRALRFEIEAMMPDDPVKRVDNMTMAWALEARVPFLDPDLVALAARCPAELKLADGGKGILKDIGRKVLPAEVVDRPKGYFPVPGLVQLDDSVVARLREVLGDPAARRRGLLRPEAVDRLLAAPNEQLTPTGGNVLWPLALLEWWFQEHVDR